MFLAHLSVILLLQIPPDPVFPRIFFWRLSLRATFLGRKLLKIFVVLDGLFWGRFFTFILEINISGELRLFLHERNLLICKRGFWRWLCDALWISTCLWAGSLFALWLTFDFRRCAYVSFSSLGQVRKSRSSLILLWSFRSSIFLHWWLFEIQSFQACFRWHLIRRLLITY